MINELTPTELTFKLYIQGGDNDGPVITKVSQLENDIGYITMVEIEPLSEQLVVLASSLSAVSSSLELAKLSIQALESVTETLKATDLQFASRLDGMSSTMTNFSASLADVQQQYDQLQTWIQSELGSMDSRVFALEEDNIFIVSHMGIIDDDLDSLFGRMSDVEKANDELERELVDTQDNVGIIFERVYDIETQNTIVVLEDDE